MLGLLIYYFDYNGQTVKITEKVIFTKSIPFAQIIGSQFSLVDTNYQTIGFNNELKTMFNTILVNEDSQDEVYEPILDGWIER
ncbi:hypothetical protein [Desemzia sp. FAM 24101]